jgi:hypothetical protein
MNVCAGNMSIAAEVIARRFADGRCLYCSGFNYRAAECGDRKKAQMFKAAGAVVKKVGTGSDPEKSGKDLVN